MFGYDDMQAYMKAVTQEIKVIYIYADPEQAEEMLGDLFLGITQTAAAVNENVAIVAHGDEVVLEGWCTDAKGTHIVMNDPVYAWALKAAIGDYYDEEDDEEEEDENWG